MTKSLQLIDIIQSQIKSLLCTPLVNQGKLVGILYLENNLTTGAFETPSPWKSKYSHFSSRHLPRKCHSLPGFASL